MHSETFEDQYLLTKIFGEYVYSYCKVKSLNTEVAKRILNTKFNLINFNMIGYYDYRQVQWVTFGAMKVLSSDDSKALISASAVLVNSTIGKMFGNLYYSMLTPPFPSRYFTNPDEALNWLSSTTSIPCPDAMRKWIKEEGFNVNYN